MEDKVRKRVGSCERRLKEMTQDESDDEFLESLKDQLELWKRKQGFIDSVIGLGFLPCEVPGDGNCALWTLCALLGALSEQPHQQRRREWHCERTLANCQGFSDSVIAFLCPGSWSGWRPKC